MHALSLEQIQQLAPDESSWKAAKSLKKQQWVLKAAKDSILWGHYQGSGKNPYQTAIDLNNEPAFKCSCPSRKFPCKHALSLLILYQSQPQDFTAENEPNWLLDWIEKRKQNQIKKIQKKESPVQIEEQEKRFAKRLNNAQKGLQDLQIWLHDLLRNGLLNIPNQNHHFRQMAKRMMDAQMPAIAQQLFYLADLDSQKKELLLLGLTRLHTFIEMMQRYDALNESWQAEIEQRLGFNTAKEKVLAQEGITDIWLSIAHLRFESSEQKGETHIHWLYGLGSQKFAYILDFALRHAHYQPSVLAGAQYAGELCFYLGVESQRALPKHWEKVQEALPFKDIKWNLEMAKMSIQKRFSLNPLIEQSAFRLDDVFLVHHQNQWGLSDGQSILRIDLSDAQKLKIIAETEGQNFTTFMLYHHLKHEYQLLSYINAQGKCILC